jgi:hypothetical protein
VREYRFDSFVGHPEYAELTVLSPSPKTIRGPAPALVPSTPDDGISAELLYVGKGDNYEAFDAKGKIVLIDGLSNPRLAKLAEEQGAVGEVFINDEHAREGIASVVWGTPTPETAHLLPRTPSINITASEGEALTQLLKRGPVNVRLKTKVWRGWKKIPVVTADLKGRTEDDFVLLSGHIDSWYYGAMDNGSANATMLEVARILAEHRSALRRGIRLAFWSGHSHGRYSGSTWYADNFWEDLHEHCIAHVNVDSPGAKGSTVLTEAFVMAEAKDFASSAVEHVSGQRLAGHRFSRAGDQSFWGLGIPAIFMSLSEQPPSESKIAAFVFGPRSGGLGWWWHTRADTIDKIDPEFLARDTKVYLLLIWQLCTLPLLPFNYTATVAEIELRLKELETRASGQFDVTPLIDKARRLKNSITRLNREAVKLKKKTKAKAAKPRIARINQTLKTLGQLLIPINYSKAGPFDHDLAVPIPPLPLLDRIGDLTKFKAESDEFRFLITRLRRESNKVAHALREAEKITTDTVKELHR